MHFPRTSSMTQGLRDALPYNVLQDSGLRDVSEMHFPRISSMTQGLRDALPYKMVFHERCDFQREARGAFLTLYPESTPKFQSRRTGRCYTTNYHFHIPSLSKSGSHTLRSPHLFFFLHTPHSVNCYTFCEG